MGSEAAKKDADGAKSKSAEENTQDKFKYRLVGVLIHSGSADAGHYYSYIKERNP
jgi:ubiquitin C-terminal hydrolase